jgi:hypothetical protein
MSRSYQGIYSQENIHMTFFKNIAITMDINQDHQELSHTKPYHTKLAHMDIYIIPWWTMYIGDAFPIKCIWYKMHATYHTKMTIHHDTNAMQNARNAQRKAIHILQKSSRAPTQEIKQTPSSPHKLVKVAWSRGLVKISASWSCVGTWIKAISPTSMLALRKWYLTSMCLVLEWSTGFYATLMALVLSLWSGNGYTPH